MERAVESRNRRLAPAFKAARLARSMVDCCFCFWVFLLIEVFIVWLLTVARHW